MDWNVYFIAESELPKGSPADRAFPKVSTDVCFNTDVKTLKSEKSRLDSALKVLFPSSSSEDESRLFFDISLFTRHAASCFRESLDVFAGGSRAVV